MQHMLFLDTDLTPKPFLLTAWPILLPLALGFLAIYCLLPRIRRRPLVWGAMAGSAALVVAGLFLIHIERIWPETLLFYTFAGIAVLAGGLMITQSNPVYAALSFALVVLSSCGLFLLQAAPFLAVATIIIYAGAIVVTFLFVIMLAQPDGYSDADLRSREPFLATLAGFVLMGATLVVLQRALDTTEIDRCVVMLEKAKELTKLEDARLAKNRDNLYLRVQTILGTENDQVNQLENYLAIGKDFDAKVYGQKVQAVLDELADVVKNKGSLSEGTIPGKTGEPGVLPARNVFSLGQTLFTDYLIPVELAGVLLLVATIGAIAIVGRHSEVLR